MHDNGRARQADDSISTPGISQAVRGNSDLPARAWGAASTLPQRPTVRAMDASSRPQCEILRQHSRSRKRRSRSHRLGQNRVDSVGAVGLLLPPTRPDFGQVKSTSDEIAKNHHWREAGVEVSTAHPVASRTETIRRIGGPSKSARWEQ